MRLLFPVSALQGIDGFLKPDTNHRQAKIIGLIASITYRHFEILKTFTHQVSIVNAGSGPAVNCTLHHNLVQSPAGAPLGRLNGNQWRFQQMKTGS